MTTTRRLACGLAALLLTAALAGLAMQAAGAAQTLRLEVGRNNRDSAGLLALALAERQGDPAALRGLAEVQAASGHYRRLQLQQSNGALIFDLRPPSRAERAPRWFASAWPLAGSPGRALVADGYGGSDGLTVETNAAWAQDALWDAVSLAAAVLLGCWLVVMGCAVWVWRGFGRALKPRLAQAEALAQGRFVDADEGRWPGLAELTQSLNALAGRMREGVALQAEQVALLQRRVQLDAVTGLALRSHFVAQLQQRLTDSGGPGVALLLVRVLHLETLNPRLGHEAADRLLAAIADVLLTYVDRVPAAFAGRLNGSDFALCLPVRGVARETAESLRAALAASATLRSGGAEVVIGGADGLRDIGAGAALSAADNALARAEAEADGGAAGGCVVEDHVVASVDVAGVGAWREQIGAALADGRVQLGESRVIDSSSRLVHLECLLRVQLAVGDEYQTAARWLAQSPRSRLLPQVDLAALALALRAIAADGLPRAVQASPLSLSMPGFVAEAARRLRATPAAARKLSIECLHPMQPVAFAPLASASAVWRPLGVRLGVEHAAGLPQELARLHQAGIDYVRVDARHLRGIAADAALRSYAQSLLDLIHGLGLQAMAGGIDAAPDLEALWQLGFDSATGPAVALQESRVS